MKIVYFIDHLRPDGTQHVLKQLVGGLHERGHVQYVLCLNDSWDEIFKQQLEDAGCEVKIIGKPAIFTGIGLLRIFTFLQRHQFDAAVTFLFASDLIGRPLARLAGLPRLVTSIQARDEFYSPFMRWLIRRTIRLANVIQLSSEHIRKFAISQEGAPPDRIRVIYHSIRAELYEHPSTRQEMINGFDLPGSAVLLGTIGRLTYQKGLDVLLPALAQIPQDNIHLLVAGQGEELEHLQALAVKLGIGDRVHFLGYRRDIPGWLGGLDLYVHAARYEGMPIAILEAMAAGCPIVATAVDGTRELIEDQKYGWLVPAEEPAQFTKAIQEALANPEEARQRGQAARRRVIKEFSEQKMIDEWEKILEGQTI
jgi:glycosyltransferase involved in cell wall biosynthesis